MSKALFYKHFLLYIILLQLSGCVGIGKNTIHSPSAAWGEPMKHQHIHGGPTKKSPNDAIVFSYEMDSISVRVSARVIKYKPILAGPLIPIFPAFLIPGQKYYRKDQNILEIKLAVRTVNDIIVNADSVRINFAGSNYFPDKSLRISQTNFQEFDTYQLGANSKDYYEMHSPYSYHEFPDQFKFHFGIAAEYAEDFKLEVNCFYIRSKKIEIPEIFFEKKKQTWVFAGP